jgi:CHAT domain-containing protein
VAAIRILSSSFPRLAFLAACHSANFEDESTVDEVVHVAKAFQLADFPSVVGTLWQAFVADAAIVSGEFYGYLKRRMDHGGVNEFDGDLFARALHSAVSCLREKNPYSCVNWASWIHYGD